MTTKNVESLSYMTSYRQSVDYFMVITVGNHGSVVIVGYLRSLTGIFPGGTVDFLEGFATHSKDTGQCIAVMCNNVHS